MIQTLKTKNKMMILISLTTMTTFYQRKKISKRRSMSILKLVKLKEDIKENIQSTPKPALISIPSSVPLPTIPEISRSSSSSSSSSISFTEITPHLEPVTPSQVLQVAPQVSHVSQLAPKPRKFCC